MPPANGPDLPIVWQAAHEKHRRGDLAAEPFSVDKTQQRGPVGRPGQARQQVLEAEVQQEPTLGDRTRAQALGQRHPDDTPKVDMDRDVLLPETHERIAPHRVTVVGQQTVARRRRRVVQDERDGPLVQSAGDAADELVELEIDVDPRTLRGPIMQGFEIGIQARVRLVGNHPTELPRAIEPDPNLVNMAPADQPPMNREGVGDLVRQHEMMRLVDSRPT